jgi:hypothetical protein
MKKCRGCGYDFAGKVREVAAEAKVKREKIAVKREPGKESLFTSTYKTVD